MRGYASFLVVRHELPVYSRALYLRPDADRRDLGLYGYSKSGLGLQFNYKAIRLCELDGQSVLDAVAIGLLPFTPLMSAPVGLSASAWVETCVAAGQSAPVDSRRVRRYCLVCLCLGV